MVSRRRPHRHVSHLHDRGSTPVDVRRPWQLQILQIRLERKAALYMGHDDPGAWRTVGNASIRRGSGWQSVYGRGMGRTSAEVRPAERRRSGVAYWPADSRGLEQLK